MGLGASVLCRCYAEGRTTPPPGPVRLDANGRPELDMPYEGNVRAHVAFGRWRESCCEHPDMLQFCEDIANWPGYRGLQHALGQVGWEHFPTLRAVLPKQNEGAVPAALADEVIDELRRFEAVGVYGRDQFLVDTDTGEALFQRRVSLGGSGAYMISAAQEVGLDHAGLYVQAGGGSGEVVFRSGRFSQTVLPGGGTDRVVWTDLDSGACCEPVGAIRGSQRSVPGELPWVYTDVVSNLHVEERPVSTADFAAIVGAMIRAFRAAIETGNPVVWD